MEFNDFSARLRADLERRGLPIPAHLMSGAANNQAQRDALSDGPPVNVVDNRNRPLKQHSGSSTSFGSTRVASETAPQSQHRGQEQGGGEAQNKPGFHGSAAQNESRTSGGLDSKKAAAIFKGNISWDKPYVEEEGMIEYAEQEEPDIQCITPDLVTNERKLAAIDPAAVALSGKQNRKAGGKVQSLEQSHGKEVTTSTGMHYQAITITFRPAIDNPEWMRVLHQEHVDLFMRWEQLIAKRLWWDLSSLAPSKEEVARVQDEFAQQLADLQERVDHDLRGAIEREKASRPSGEDERKDSKGSVDMGATPTIALLRAESHDLPQQQGTEDVEIPGERPRPIIPPKEPHLTDSTRDVSAQQRQPSTYAPTSRDHTAQGPQRRASAAGSPGASASSPYQTVPPASLGLQSWSRNWPEASAQLLGEKKLPERKQKADVGRSAQEGNDERERLRREADKQAKRDDERAQLKREAEERERLRREAQKHAEQESARREEQERVDRARREEQEREKQKREADERNREATKRERERLKREAEQLQREQEFARREDEARRRYQERKRQEDDEKERRRASSSSANTSSFPGAPPPFSGSADGGSAGAGIPSALPSFTSATVSAGGMERRWEEYEKEWTGLQDKAAKAALRWNDIPWPMILPPRGIEGLVNISIANFILSPTHSQGKGHKQRLRQALRRWHPDRFDQPWLPKCAEGEREQIKKGVGFVVRCLNELLSVKEAS